VLAGGLGHHPAALLDEQKCRLPRDRSGRGQRRNLAEAVPRGDADMLEPVGLAPYLVGGPAHGHHARLDDIGPVQLSDRAFEAQLAHRHLEQLFSALEDPPRGGIPVVEVLAHARLLHPLPGEQQRDRSG